VRRPRRVTYSFKGVMEKIRLQGESFSKDGALLSIFQYFPEYMVMICRECKGHVFPQLVRTHVDTKHAYLPVAVVERCSISRRR
jgi:hypothetical protein